MQQDAVAAGGLIGTNTLQRDPRLFRQSDTNNVFNRFISLQEKKSVYQSLFKMRSFGHFYVAALVRIPRVSSSGTMASVPVSGTCLNWVARYRASQKMSSP